MRFLARESLGPNVSANENRCGIVGIPIPIPAKNNPKTDRTSSDDDRPYVVSVVSVVYLPYEYAL